MAEPPQRPQPDRYDELRALENTKGETPKEEPVKTENRRGGPQTSHMPALQAFMNDYGKDAQAHMDQMHARAKQQEANKQTDAWKATENSFKNQIEGITMDGKTGDAKSAAATNESRPKDQIAREELARSIANEKKADQQQERTNTKGKERGDD